MSAYSQLVQAKPLEVQWQDGIESDTELQDEGALLLFLIFNHMNCWWDDEMMPTAE